jgi:hypothetical protein
VGVESNQDGDIFMVPQDGVLLQLLGLIDQLPLALSVAAGKRGRPYVYAERLFLKALVVMILRHLPTVHALLAVLAVRAEPSRARVRGALSVGGRFPARRPFERRLQVTPPGDASR